MANPVLQKLLTEVQNKYGENAVMLAKDMKVYPPITSGSIAVDFAVGIGGLPSDRVIEIGGVEATGKTTLALLAMKSFLEAQPDRFALVLDMEHKITRDWAIRLVGEELWDERVVYAQPDYLEQATNMYIDLVSSGQVCFCVLDSIAGAPVKAAMEKDAEKVQVSGNAGAVTKFARLAATYSAKYRCLTVGINQERDDMDGFHRYTTPGGRGWKAACVLRIRLKKSTTDKVEATVDGEKMVVGRKIFAQMVKNQLAAEGRVAYYWFYYVETPEYGFGIDTLDEVVRLAILTGVIRQAGSWYHHLALPEYKTSGEHKVQSAKGLGELIGADPALSATIVSETMAVLKSDGKFAATIAPVDPDVIEEDE